MSRKEREKIDREAQILKLARTMLLSDGYEALTMGRLASEMEYAKGTLYNHFPNKEEIVTALALQSLELRRKMFEEAALLSSQSRERLMAIGSACELYATRCGEHFAIEQMLRNAIIWEKSSETRQTLIRTCELRSMGIVAGVVRDAVVAGDLILPQMSPEEFVFGFWSLTYGSHALIATSPSLPEVGVNDPLRSIRYHCWTLMNGYGWRPLIEFEEADRMMHGFSERIVSHVDS